MLYYKMINPDMMKKIKEHSKKHEGGMNSKHMKNMMKFVKAGDTFSKAHTKAKAMDKKDITKKTIKKAPVKKAKVKQTKPKVKMNSSY